MFRQKSFEILEVKRWDPQVNRQVKLMGETMQPIQFAIWISFCKVPKTNKANDSTAI